MGRMTASSVLVAFLAATVAALPSTLLEDTKQAAIQTGPIISKGKEQIIYHAASLKVYSFCVIYKSIALTVLAWWCCAASKAYVLLKIRI